MNSIRIDNDLMFVLDNEGHGRDCHILQTIEAAKEQLDRWQETYTFDYDEAIILLAEYFKKEPTDEVITEKLERIVKHLLKIPTLSCRGAPDLDFHMMHVLELRLVLRAAYEVGRASAR